MKASKNSIKKWREHCKLVQEQTIVNALENSDEKQKRIERLKNNYEAFIEYYFPHYCANKSAQFQIDAANYISQNKNIMYLAEWFRSAGKSVHMNIFIPMFLKSRNEMNVMLLVGKSQENAITLLGDLQAELQYNERYISDYGVQMNLGSWEAGRFYTKDDKAFIGIGRMQSARGTRYKKSRVDLIIIDDIDSEDLCENESRVNKAMDWLLSGVYNTMDMGKGKFIVVGNRISKNSVIAKMAEVPGIKHTIVNALDENGIPTWKEKYTTEQINEVIETIGSRRAQQELFNNPITDGAVFKLKNINYTTMELFSDYRYVVSYTDPSFKSSSKSDYKATVLTAVNSKGEFHILKSYVDKTTVSNMVNWHYQINTEYGSKIPIYYYMEANFVQDILFKEFYEEGLKMGFQIPIIGDKRSKPDKFQRIENLQPLFERGLVFFNEKEKETAGMKTLINQLLMTEKGSRYADDGPDSLEGAIWLLLNKVQIEQPIIIGLRGEGKYRNVMRY